MDKRLEKRLLRRNFKNLLKTGTYLNDKIIIKDYFNFKIDLNSLISNFDSFINRWRYVNLNNKKLKYLTITKPYINKIEEDYIDLTISKLISLHYYKVFGYNFPYYLKINFYKIKNSQFLNLDYNKKYGKVVDTNTLINNWVKNNKNSKEYLYYKDLIIKQNNFVKDLKTPIYYGTKKDKNSYTIILPFEYNETYKNLFLNLDKIKYSSKVNDYLENGIERLFDFNVITSTKLNELHDNKNFLEQFKPLINQ